MFWYTRRSVTMPALLLAGVIVVEAAAAPEAASKPSGGEVRPATQDVWSDLESMSAKDFQALVRRMTDNDPQETLFATQEQVRDLAKDTFRGLPVVVLKRHLKDLIVLLDSDDTRIVILGAQALERLGPAAKAAVPGLIRMLRFGSSSYVRRTAIETLVAVDPANDEVVAAIVDALIEPPVIDAIGTLRVDIRRYGLISPDRRRGYEEVGLAALDALGRIGKPAAKMAMPVALDGSARRQCTICLGRMGPEAAVVAPLLEDLVGKNLADGRWYAAAALCRMGFADKYAPLLIEAALKPDEPETPYERPFRRANVWSRGQGIEALGQVDPQTPRVLPTLLSLVNDKDAHVRLAAVVSLGQLRPVPREAIPAIVEALKKDGSVRSRGVDFFV